MKNEFSKEIPSEVVEQVKTKLEECRELLRPYGVSLTNTERQEIPALGTRNTGKVTSIMAEMEVAPEYAPAMFEIDEVKKDFRVISALDPISKIVSEIRYLVDDTITVAGSEVLLGCMDYYSSVKRFAAQNDPKAEAIFDRLKPMFARNKPEKAVK